MKKIDITEAFADQIAESPADQIWLASMISKKALDEDALKEKFLADFETIDEATEPDIEIKWDKLTTLIEDAENQFTSFYTDLTEAIGGIDIEGLSDEDKAKTVGVFENYFSSVVIAYADKLEEDFQSRVDEDVATAVEEINESVEVDLREWAEGKADEIQTYIKRKADSQIVEDVKRVLVDHGVDVNDEAESKRTELDEKIEGLEEKIAEQDVELVEFKKTEIRQSKKGVLIDVAEGLTDLEKAKLLKLSEGVRFIDEDQYKSEIDALKETFLSKPTNKLDEDKDDKRKDLNESLSDAKAQFKQYMNG